MRLLGKKALVTGAARGIGRGCALALAREGADLALNDRDESDELLALVDEIRHLGRTAIACPGDAFDADSRERLVQTAITGLGSIDILISNPAMNRRAAFLDQDPAEFSRIIDATLISGFHISQLVASHLVARGQGGKIVFISSVHDRIPYANNAAYNAAKAGLKHFARTIAAELLPHRINVNVIEPGWIDTPGERAVFGDPAIDRAGAGLPWGRLGTPDDIGRVAAFLASADSDYITGASVLVDGGLCLDQARQGG